MKIKIDKNEELNNNNELCKIIEEQIYYLFPEISVFRILANEINIELSENTHNETFLQSQIQEQINQLIQSSKKTLKLTVEKVFWENGPDKLTSMSDPHEELIHQGYLKPTSNGQAVYSGDLYLTIENLDSLVKKIALKLKASPEEYPTTIQYSHLIQSGYLKSFPQHAFISSPLKPELSIINEFISSLPSSSNELTLNKLNPQNMNVLSPTVCYHCFEALKDKTISPPQIFTASSKCHRHEYKTHFGLERLQTFKMREIIFFGNESFVLETRNKIMEETKQLIEKLGLKARIVSANDPFFASDAAKKRAFQSFLGLKQEIQCLLPYNNKWLSIGSFNIHKDSLTQPFNIKSNTPGEIILSGCVGFGLERWSLAGMAQTSIKEFKLKTDSIQ